MNPLMIQALGAVTPILAQSQRSYDMGRTMGKITVVVMVVVVVGWVGGQVWKSVRKRR